MSYKTIKVRFQEQICYLQFYRPEANNTINAQLVEECHQVLALCEESMIAVVLEGLPDVFCFGADFKDIHNEVESENNRQLSAEPLYDLWQKLTAGPYVTIAHVRGKVNAGGMGFVAACDIVLADQSAKFSLSELLFGIFPACVMPFLIRRIGFQKAHYLTLTAQPIPVLQAQRWGLVDDYEDQSDSLLHKHLLRLSRLSKFSILRYKNYMSGLYDSIQQSKSMALTANREIFSDPQILKGIEQFVEKRIFPWER